MIKFKFFVYPTHTLSWLSAGAAIQDLNAIDKVEFLRSAAVTALLKTWWSQCYVALEKAQVRE